MNHVIALLLWGGAGGGGEPQEKKPKAGWDWLWTAEVELAYDSNIWNLEDVGQSRLEDERPQEEANGRYDDMETVEDFIITPTLRWDGNAPSPFGRRFDVGIGLEVPVYLQNSRRTHVEIDLGVGQAVGPDGHLGLRFQFIPEYFRKNYLADAIFFGTTTPVPDGSSVGQFDRVYEAGVYQEWETELEYRHKLIDRTQNQPFGLTGSIELSYSDRSYDSPLSYRDEEATGVRFGLGFQYGPRLRWGLRYQFVAVESPGKTHIVLVDPGNIRRNTKIDRAHDEHEIGLSLGVEVSNQLEVGIVYERLLRDFKSDNLLDVEYVGREDERNSVEVNLLYKISKAWHAEIAYLWRRQESDLDDPSGGDDGDYDRFVVYGSIAYRW